jgi:sugar transferase (PEP-CTERM/EpsH1 system associated)
MPPTDNRPLIVHVVYRFAIGGLENGIVNLVNRMPHACWRHAIVALTEASETFRSRITRDDVEVVSLNKPPGHGVRVYPQLYGLFRRWSPVVVHTYNLAALEAVVPAWAARAPVRIHGEYGRDMSDVDGTRRRYRLVRRIYRPFVHEYVALSRDLERYLIEGIGVARNKVRHIYNGVDTVRFQPASGERARVEGGPFNDPRLFVVGTVGRMDPVKDQANLVQAFAHALRSTRELASRLRLVLVGDGPLRGELEALIRSGGLADQVWFTGERADVPALMQGLDCFVLPSLAEGIPNVLLEAMASGLPVIATRVGDNADLMEEGATGFLVPRADSAALADPILRYAADPGLARRHGKAGRQVVERRFSIDRMIADYEDLYRTALTARGIALAGSAVKIVLGA